MTRNERKESPEARMGRIRFIVQHFAPREVEAPSVWWQSIGEVDWEMGELDG